MPEHVRVPGALLVPTTRPGAPRRSGRWAAVAVLLLTAGILAGVVYGKLSANLNSEYFHIARALVAGRGFADPFGVPTGPTAWMPPLLPGLQAAVLWISDGDRSAVIRLLVVLHTAVLIGTGLLVIGLAFQTSGRFGAVGAAVAFAVGLVCNFRSCFQLACDAWIHMLFLDLLIAGLYWMRPLGHWRRTIGWGLLGGLCAMANPIIGFTWGIVTVLLGLHGRAWRRLGVAVFVAALAVAPWTIRNGRVFGRFIPVKSNLAYELFQAQCLQAPGVLKAGQSHPYFATSQERQEYRRLGEPDYMARKWQQFADAVGADPVDYLNRVASRFLCATVWYESSAPAQDRRRPWLAWLNRCMHPVPFLALVALLFFATQSRLRPIEWVVIGVYLCCLLPYIAVSYYDRYALPLLGVKALLVVWAAERLTAFGPGRLGHRRRQAPGGEWRAPAAARRRGPRDRGGALR
jgi:hypothetical protein